MLSEMKERTKNIQGVVIEDNRFCLSVHFRHVKDKVCISYMHLYMFVYTKRGRFRKILKKMKKMRNAIVTVICTVCTCVYK